MADFFKNVVNRKTDRDCADASTREAGPRPGYWASKHDNRTTQRASPKSGRADLHSNLSLPKGGGPVRDLGEKLLVNAATGTGAFRYRCRCVRIASSYNCSSNMTRDRDRALSDLVGSFLCPQWPAGPIRVCRVISTKRSPMYSSWRERKTSFRLLSPNGSRDRGPCMVPSSRCFHIDRASRESSHGSNAGCIG